MICNVKFDKHFKLNIKASKVILLELIDMLTGTYEQVFRTRGKNATLQRKLKYKCIGDYNRKDSVLTCHQGIFPYIVLFLEQLSTKYPDLQYIVPPTPLGDLKIIPKWEERYLEFDPEQLEHANRLLKLKSASCQLPTGTGKTEIFLGIIESFLEQREKGNVVIIVDTNALKNSTMARLKQWGLDHHIDGRLKIINAKGFMRSKYFLDPELVDWLKDVTMVIVDEMHHAGADSFARFYDLSDKLEFVYGFSATVDDEDITNFRRFQNFNIFTKEILSRTGPCLVQRWPKDNDRTIKYCRVNGDFGTTRLNADKATYAKVVEEVVSNPVYLNMVEKVIRTYGYEKDDRVFFIPVPHTAPGRTIAYHLESKGIPTIQWTGGELYPECLNDLVHGETKSKYDVVKEALESGVYKALITTSTANEGIDIPILSAVIVAFGKDWKFAVQAPGRASRGKARDPLVFNIYNRGNPLMKSQFRGRHKMIDYAYNFETKIWKFN